MKVETVDNVVLPLVGLIAVMVVIMAIIWR